jgi:hypothetical protein
MQSNHEVIRGALVHYEHTVRLLPSLLGGCALPHGSLYHIQQPFWCVPFLVPSLLRGCAVLLVLVEPQYLGEPGVREERLEHPGQRGGRDDVSERQCLLHKPQATAWQNPLATS